MLCNLLGCTLFRIRCEVRVIMMPLISAVLVVVVCRLFITLGYPSESGVLPVIVSERGW